MKDKFNFKFSKYAFVFIVLMLGLSACHTSRMFKTPKDFVYAQIPDSQNIDYVIQKNDYLSMRLYSNDGFALVDLLSVSESKGALGDAQLVYKVEYDGTVKLPVVGRVKLEGMKRREAEMYLEELYAKYYVKPFVILNVTNKRIIVFNGGYGNAHVIPLQNENIRLVEALALAGGIQENGKAWKVKVIRGPVSNPQVFKFNLRYLDTYKNSGIVIQPNDIIYVEPRARIAQTVIRDIAPIISLVSSVVTIIVLINRIP